ncbi:hypothetical protein [Laceyella tengchongensis]
MLAFLYQCLVLIGFLLFLFIAVVMAKIGAGKKGNRQQKRTRK